MNLDEVWISGVKVNRVTMEDSINLLEKFIFNRENHQVCVPNAWTTVLMQKDREFREINNSSSLAIPDGMPLVWASRLYGKPIQERVSGPDLFQKFIEVASCKKYKFFFLGSSPDILEKLSSKLKKKYPGLKIAGTYAPPFSKSFSEEEDKKMIDMINMAKPDILWVGLTAPKQEKWIGKNINHLKVPVSIGVGAAFDFIAGKVKRAPKWMQKAGLEWFYRLYQEPKRLWKRYIIGNTLFIWLVIKELIKIKLQSKKIE